MQKYIYNDINLLLGGGREGNNYDDILSVYFRISLKRGQTSSARIQGGGGGQPHIKYRESQLLREGAGQINPGWWAYMSC